MATANAYCFIEAPVQKVFEVLTDHEHYDQFNSVSTSSLPLAGKTDRNGVGAVRDLTVSVIRFIEDITRFDAPQVMEYRVRECYFSFRNNRYQVVFPLIHKHGQITLTEKNGGTHIHWQSQFSVKLVFGEQIARLMCPRVERTFGNILKDMAICLKK